MFNNFSIRTRLIVLLSIQVFFLLLIGLTSLYALSRAADDTQGLAGKVNNLAENLALRNIIINRIHDQGFAVFLGAVTWSEGRSSLNQASDDFEKAWNRYISLLDNENRKQFINDSKPESIREAIKTLQGLYKTENLSNLQLFLLNDFKPLISPLLDKLAQLAINQQQASLTQLTRASAENNYYLYLNSITFVLGLLILATLGATIYRSIARPVKRISDTVLRIASGDFNARTMVSGVDEIGHLGIAFDNLLDDKVTTLTEIERENDRLNDSVIGLLQVVSKLSQKDLTTRATITDDLAGPLADAVNRLASETGTVMADVQRIANQVMHASNEVNHSAQDISQVAIKQQTEVQNAAERLSNTSEGMAEIANLAEQCNQIAIRTTKSTETAASSVQGALTNIQDIRSTIQETAKRLKRLAERSQEISSIVDIINGFAERTTVLALNASMQAAAAGEAGRGFAVVADEVQRLAESSRNATAQISVLVKNIQVETTDAMATMDRTIDQVVNGSKLAETAGTQMKTSTSATTDLVRGVVDITVSSKQHAEATAELLAFTSSLKDQAVRTSQRLEEQLTHTRNLANFANELVESVQTFKVRQGS